ncbi:hypothetical protein AKJ09_02298 [Labilithrix luteola]|uniref:Uncharacterized protein n=1 Tax=Labilithrix luteola TaxID=1391654 RepID=A0A0K1PR95_9BACT|nr:hypothetical protein [Labilithrix luteola]AKU95634.1 hypothetical protein AKJ09_02298 [Labilithrix luteola]
MKTDPTHDVSSDDATPEAFRAFVRARQSGPSREVLERMASRLTQAGVLGQDASRSPMTAPATSRLAHLKVGLVALAIATGFGAWRATETRSFVPAAAVPIAAPETAVVVASASTSNEPAPQALPVLSVEQLPSVPSAPRPSAAPSVATAIKPAATELELVQRAQAAVASDPARALAVAAEHARAYPAGAFVQEREVIAVEALARLGRIDEAWKRAVELVRRFPGTPYATRLERALGRSLSSTSPSSPSSPAPTP